MLRYQQCWLQHGKGSVSEVEAAREGQENSVGVKRECAAGEGKWHLREEQ